jgi:hypothetical protein
LFHILWFNSFFFFLVFFNSSLLCRSGLF